eukprot:TRINITY_DN1402_c0_g1_i4.p1 TRINITY_DN1402_c0_g1~~TRINITY_DN1402_c0_g1_i4.p1  ORF type:complete len:463 (+),score=126.99 TRINITY_DN1402_c0_g1_i4:147-1535(+)
MQGPSTSRAVAGLLCLVLLLQWVAMTGHQTQSSPSEIAWHAQARLVENAGRAVVQQLHLRRGAAPYDLQGPRARPIAGGTSRAELQARTAWAQARFAGFYDCSDGAHEHALAGAWLTSTETFLSIPSFKSFDEAQALRPEHVDAVDEMVLAALRGRVGLKPLDLFDFRVQKLSYYWRHLKLGDGYVYNALVKIGDPQAERLPSVLKNLEHIERRYLEGRFHNPTGTSNGRVLAVMPITVVNPGTVDAEFIKLAVKATAEVFPNVVLAVHDVISADWIAQSGLREHLYDVIFLGVVPHPNWIPLMALTKARERLASKAWDPQFEWVYVTEHDQIPHVRDVDRLLHAASAPETVVVPHRSTFYPRAEDFPMTNRSRAAELAAGKGVPAEIPEKRVEEVPDVLEASCCFERGTHCVDGSGIIPIGDKAVYLLRERWTWAYAAGTHTRGIDDFRPCELKREGSACG